MIPYVSTHALSTIARRAAEDYVSAPRIQTLGQVAGRHVARLHFNDGGLRLVSTDNYGGDYVDDYPDGMGIDTWSDEVCVQQLVERHADG